LTLLHQVPAPHAVLAGDFNEVPGKPAWRAFQAGGLRDLGPESGVTFPARGPRKRIDGILGSPGIAAVEYRVVDDPLVERASDHRPVLAVLQVPR
jgi:endonuclease/exonuclease/phosphatase family metal-dependent hydrolase